MSGALPTLDQLGRDLLRVPRWRRAVSLSAPFALTALFFVFFARGWWLAALACPVMLSLLTYASISHDLVHRNLGLPRWLNESLLAAIELLAFRSGHAYRVSHLHHHSRFPAPDDVEGAAAGMSWWRALLDGPALQGRLWLMALQRRGPHRLWVVLEGATVLSMLGASLAIIRSHPAPAIFAALMIAGSWIYPFMTSFLPHNPHGTSELTQTRLFRGRFFSILALEHLYHLEHHLYPQVPHHNWPRLAARLDPAFAELGIRPVTLRWPAAA